VVGVIGAYVLVVLVGIVLRAIAAYAGVREGVAIVVLARIWRRWEAQ